MELWWYDAVGVGVAQSCDNPYRSIDRNDGLVCFFGALFFNNLQPKLLKRCILRAVLAEDVCPLLYAHCCDQWSCLIKPKNEATKMSDEAAQYSRLLAGNDANQRLKRTLHIVNGIICVRGERYRRHSPQLRKFGSIKQKSGPNCLKRLLGIIARATDNGVPSRHLHIKEHEM